MSWAVAVVVVGAVHLLDWVVAGAVEVLAVRSLSPFARATASVPAAVPCSPHTSGHGVGNRTCDNGCHIVESRFHEFHNACNFDQILQCCYREQCSTHAGMH